MDKVLAGLPFLFIYLDDILVTSTAEGEHLSNLREVLSRLRQSILAINPDKCTWAASSVVYLGHIIDSNEIRPLPKHIDAVNKFLTPWTQEHLSKFLGLLNLNRTFLPNGPHLTWVLSPKVEFSLSEREDSGFSAAKDLLPSAVSLHHPKQVLSCICPQKHFNIAQTNYSVFNNELTMAFMAIRHFKHLLEGNCFTFCLDHLPTVQALTKVLDPWSSRQSRMIKYIAVFPVTAENVPGQKNMVADLFSCYVSANTLPSTRQCRPRNRS